MRVLTRISLVFLMVLPSVVHGQVETEPQDKVVKIMLGGDTMVGRYMGRKLRLHGGEDPFAEIGHLLKRTSATIINLETPVTDIPPKRIRRGGKFKDYSTTFRMPTRYLDILKKYGVDAVVLANNHAEDCDTAGVGQTRENLDKAGIHHVGTNILGDQTKDLRFSAGDFMITVVAVDVYRNRGWPIPGQKLPVNYMRERRAYKWVAERMRTLRKERPDDLLVASLHWGKQYVADLQGGQVHHARSIINAGADVVFGHHPHVLHAVEPYKDGIILYSTGNLVFDMKRWLSRRSALFELTFEKKAGGGYLAKEMIAHAIALRGVQKGPRLATTKETKSYLKPLLNRKKAVKVGRFHFEDTKLIWRR